MATAGLISLAERGASKHTCVGTEAEEEEREEERNQDHSCYTLGEEYLVCWGGFGGREYVHYCWDGQENEDNHHEGREDCCKVAIETQSLLVISGVKEGAA